MICPCSDNHVTIKNNEAHLHAWIQKKYKLSVKKRTLWKTVWHYLLKLEACITNRSTISLLERPIFTYVCMCTDTQQNHAEARVQECLVYVSNVLPNSITHDNFKLETIQILSRAAAAATKSLQSCPTLCDPRDGSPPGSPVPGILQARTLEWVAISFSNAWKWKWSHSVVSDSVRPHGLQPTRLLHPWDFPGKSTGMGCHCLLHLSRAERINWNSVIGWNAEQQWKCATITHNNTEESYFVLHVTAKDKGTHTTATCLYRVQTDTTTTTKKQCLRDAKERNDQEGGDSVFLWAGRKREWLGQGSRGGVTGGWHCSPPALLRVYTKAHCVIILSAIRFRFFHFSVFNFTMKMI